MTRSLPSTTIFDPGFFARSADVVAPDLLGHLLVRRTAEGLCAAWIVEVEAYLQNDPACHAFRGRTARNASMFGAPGRAYVYFIYGNHYCVNVVCQAEGVGEAVLIRAVEPAAGVEIMSRSRAAPSGSGLTNGPAKLCQAMRIDRALDGANLLHSRSPLGLRLNPERDRYLEVNGPVIVDTRIGITRAADRPLRFFLGGSNCVSRPRQTAANTGRR